MACVYHEHVGGGNGYREAEGLVESEGMCDWGGWGWHDKTAEGVNVALSKILGAKPSSFLASSMGN